MSVAYLPDLQTSEIRLLVKQLYDLDTQREEVSLSEITYYMIGYTLEYYHGHDTLPRPPYSPLENTDLYFTISEIFEQIFTHRDDPAYISSVIRNLSSDQLLMLQGMRITVGSQFDTISFPDPSFLIELANHKYNKYLTDLARARAKHSLRCEDAYWGKISGSPLAQNVESNQILLEILKKFTWWNYFEHFKHGLVFELRDPTGHGMRWSITNSTFLGLIEPIDPNLGRAFWQNKEDLDRHLST